MSDTNPITRPSTTELSKRLKGLVPTSEQPTIVQEDGALYLMPPGFSIQEIDVFIKTIFQDFGTLGQELAQLIPDTLPIDGVILESLTFKPASAGKEGKAPASYDLAFTLSWPTANWEMIPDLLALDAPSLSIEVVGGRVSGLVSGIVDIEGLPFLVQVEMPNRFFTVNLMLDPSSKPSPAPILQKFQSSPGGDSGAQKGIDLGTLTLDDLSIIGNFISGKQRGLFHLALEKIQLGPGDLALQLTLDYTAGPQSSITGTVWGDYTVPRQNPVLELMLMAEYDGPGQGWLFKGSLNALDRKDQDGKTLPPPSVKAMIAALEGKTEQTVKDIPDILTELAIKFLHLSYNTSTGDFEASCELDTTGLFAKGTEVDFIVDISLRRQGDPASSTAAPAYDKTFKGRLVFELESGLQMEFDAVFDQSPGSTLFIADYQNMGGEEINIGSLLQLIDPSFDLPFTVQLKDAFFVYENLKTAETQEAVGARFLLGLDIDGGINLSNLPLVGQLFPPDETLKIGLQPLVASGPNTATSPVIFNTAQLSDIASKVPGGGLALPAKDLKDKIDFIINLQMGEKCYTLDLPIQLSSKVTSRQPGQALPLAQAPRPIQQEVEPAPAGTETTTSPGAIATTPAGGDTASGDGIQWFDLQKSFGPVSFNRVGVQYADKKIWAFLDASLGMAGLTLSLNGLGVGTPINEFDPTFTLQGLGLDYQAGPVEIGGYFLRTRVTTDPIGKALAAADQYWEYDGLATIKAEILNISAIGSYAKVKGHTSLFLYAVLDYPIGGPPFFFVTGLAAGFGYNRAVRIPSISEVATFPLVNQAVSGEGSKPPSDPLQRRNYLQEEISQLSSYIYPKAGEYFLAAGVRFSTFELIDSFVMVSVSFGQEFEVDVLGLSTLIVPTPEEGNAVSPLAELQMALKATFAPAEGFLGIQAQLTDNSFLLSRKCKLTGGFAFFTWFGGAHEGDFVITLGGYHPLFDKPAWYPTVPRLGFNWVVTSKLTLKGEAYFALCSHALMAGGAFQALFHSGPIKAWFIIGADFIVSWKPYFYDAKLYLDMGVSYTFWLFGTHTITIHLGANLHIWGPDFSGIAKIHLWIVSFSISFGDAAPKPKPISWSTFQSSFLPQAEKVLSLTVSGGLIKEQTVGSDTWSVISPKDFRLSISSTIPFVNAKVGTADNFKLDTLQETIRRGQAQPYVFLWDGQGFTQTTGTRSISPDPHGIAPMALQASDIAHSLLQITVTKKGGSAREDFSYQPILKRMPAAMWGETLETGVNGKRYIENAICGFNILPAHPPKPSETQAIPKNDLQYTTSHIDAAFSFEPIQKAVADASHRNGKSTIRDTIANESVINKRKKLINGLGLDYDRLGISTPAGIAEDFVRNPQICTLQ